MLKRNGNEVTTHLYLCRRRRSLSLFKFQTSLRMLFDKQSFICSQCFRIVFFRKSFASGNTTCPKKHRNLLTKKEHDANIFGCISPARISQMMFDKSNVCWDLVKFRCVHWPLCLYVLIYGTMWVQQRKIQSKLQRISGNTKFQRQT